MSKQLSQVKLHLDTLKFKYPDNDISYQDGDNQLDIKVEDYDITLEHKILDEGYDMHGIKFINGVIDMLEQEILQLNAVSDITENSSDIMKDRKE